MSKYYKIKYDCGCEYEGHSPSSPRCPADHYSKIIWRDEESNQVQAGVIAKPEDCKGCAFNWGSFNTQPDDGYCYMFCEFVPNCQKYTVEL